jgi:hypothetical protein
MMRAPACSTRSALALVPALMLAAAVTAHAQAGAAPEQASASQQTAASSPWTIQAPPPKLVLIADRATSLVVTAGDAAVRGLHVIHSTLQEETTGALLSADALRLCAPEGAACTTPVDVEGGAARRVALVVDPGFTHHGTFRGTVRIAAAGPAAAQTFELTVLSSSWRSRLLGAAAIALGILVSLLITVVLRQHAARAALLLPAVRVMDEIRRIETALVAAESATGREAHGAHRRLDDLSRRLSPVELESRGYIPPRIRPAFAIESTETAYREYLAGIAANVAALDVVVRDGFGGLAARWPAGSQPQYEAAFRELDELAATVLTVEEATTGVAEVLARLAQALAPPGARAAPQAPAPARPLTRERVLVQLQTVSLALWGLWGALTLVVGIVALIATNYAFGVGTDYYRCFLWGLGVQIAGQQLEQLSPRTIATRFDIALPGE